MPFRVTSNLQWPILPAFDADAGRDGDNRGRCRIARTDPSNGAFIDMATRSITSISAVHAVRSALGGNVRRRCPDRRLLRSTPLVVDVIALSHPAAIPGLDECNADLDGAGS